MTINPAGDVTVNVTGSLAARSLSMLGDDNLSISGSLTLALASTVHDLTLSGSGVVIANGLMTLTGIGSASGDATFTGAFRNEGTLNVVSGEPNLSGAVFSNAGTVVHTGNRIDFFSASTFHNLASGVFELRQGVSRDIFFNGGAGNLFLNDGLIRRDGANTVRFEGLPLTNSTTGEIEVLTGALQLNTSGTIQGGFFDVRAGASLLLTGTTLTLAGTITGSGAGSVRHDSGTLTGGANAVLNFPTGLFNLAGDGSLKGTFSNTGFVQISDGEPNLTDGASFKNAGTFVHSGNRLDFFGGSTFHNQLGGVFELRQNVSRDIFFNGGAGNLFLNDGLIRRDGTNTVRFEALPLTNSTTGEIEVLTGTLQLNTSGTIQGGFFDVRSGASLLLTGTTLTLAGTITGSGAGSVRHDSGTLTGGANAVLNFPSGFFNWAGDGQLTGTFTNTGFVQISDGEPNLTGAALFKNVGTVVHSGNRIDFFGGSTFHNQLGGVFELRQGVSRDIFFNSGAGNLFLNDGLIRRDGTGTVRFEALPLTNTVQGEIEVLTGALQLNTTGTIQGGFFDVRAGANLLLTGTSLTLAGSITGSGGGSVRLDSGTLTGGAGAVLNFPSGLFNWAGDGQLTGTFTNTGFVQISDGEPNLTGAALFNNVGTVVHSGNRIDFFGGSKFHNQPGGVFEFRQNVSRDIFFNSGPGNLVLNEGLIRRDGTGTVRFEGLPLLNRSGSEIEVLTGELQLNTSGTIESGFFDVRAGASLLLNGTALTLAGSMTGEGAGAVRLDFGTLTGGPNAVLNFPSGLFKVGGDGSLTGTFTNTGFVQFDGEANLVGGAVFTNAGTVIHSGNRIDFFGASKFHNVASGVFELRQTVSRDVFFPSGAGNLFLNEGLIRRDGTGVVRFENLPINNPGTVQVLSGGLLVNSALTQLTGTNLTGGTWEVGNGASLSLNIPSITSNAAAVTLRGTGSFTGLGGLATNTGSLRLLDGADLTTAASFTNTGLLHLGEGSVLTAPAFAQTPQGVLEFAVGGTALADHGRLAITNAWTLGGTARVQIASDYSPATGDVITLATYGSVNGSFANFEGLSLARTRIFDRFTGANALTLTSLLNAADLQAVSITAPATGLAGQDFALSYTVQNTGAFPTFATTWTDTVYLSRDGVLSSDDIVLTRATHTGAVAAGGSYTENVTVPLTGALTGDYKVLVLADSRGFVADPDRENNLAATASFSTLDIPALTDGVAINGVIKAGQQLWYRLTVPAGETPNFTFTGAVAGEAELYVSFGEVPTRADYLEKAFALNATTQQILGEATAAGTYYVLLHGRESAGAGQSFSIEGDSVGFELVSSSLAGGSNLGKVTTTLTGAQFSPGTVFTLVPTAGAPRVAEATYYVNTRTVHATFDLTGLAAGDYDIVATRGGATETLADAFTVSAGGTAGTLQYSIGSPRFVRPQGGTVTISFENVGETDLDAPVFTLLAENARLRLNGETTFLGAAYQLDGKPFSVTELFGVSGGLAGILSPGENATIELSFQAIDASIGARSRFEVLTIGATNDPLDLATLEEELKTDGMRDDAWAAIFTNFQAGVGSTVASYREMLVENANYLGQFGPVSADLTQLLEFELEQAGEFGVIADRFTTGALGRGQVAPFSLQAFTDASGNVTLSDGETTRVFFAGTGSSFTGSGLESGKLTRSTSGELTLTEANGQRTVFRGSDGRIDFIEEASGRRSTAAYNAGGQLVSITDSLTGDASTFTYNAQGRIATATDAVGRLTTYTYDASGEHLTSVTTPQGTTTFSYITGQGAPREHALASYTGPDGVTVSNTYDARGRLASRTVGTGPDALVTSYTYDSAGLQIVTEPGARQTSVFRTLGGQLARTIDPLGEVETIRYDAAGRIISTTDASGLTTKSALSSSGLLTGIEGADRANIGVVLGGDPLRLQSLTDAGGDTTRFTYDLRGNLLSQTLPDGSASTYEYDANGRVTATTDGNGQRSTYTYNDDGLVTRRTLPVGQIDFTYDAHRNLLTATDAEGTTTFTYDAADRVTSATYPNGKSVVITYDAAGRRATVADGTGYTVRYSYDALGRLDQVRDTGNALLVDYGYDSVGQLASETRGNGSSTAYTYDAGGRLATITHRDAANAVTGSFAYTFDAQDRVKTVTTAEGTTTYTYDLAGQLTFVSLPAGRTIAYTYDLEGNRTSVVDSATGSEGYVTNPGDQYTTAGEETLTYDGEGRILTRTQGGVTTSYTYDALGQLVGIATPGSVITFDYDALGNRLGKIENGVRTDYANDPFGLGTLFGEYQGTTTTHYASGLGIAARESAGSTSFYHFDASGNTALVSGAGGAALATYKYLPFGEVVAGALAQPFTFNGQLGIQDDPGDLFHMRARAYDAELGRFTSRDPIGLAAGEANIYRFAGNDPVNKNDPSGLLTPLQILAYEYAFGEAAIGEIGVAIAGLYTEAEAAAIVAGVGSSIPAAASPSAASLIAAGGFAVLEAAVVLGGAAVLLDPSLTINALEHYDEYFRDNRDAQATKLGYPDPNEPHFSPEFVREWGKNPYFTDLVKKGLADGLNRDDAIRDAVQIIKKLGLDKEKKPDAQDKTESETVRPSDPNNVVGPAGAGADPVPAVIAPGQVRFDGFVNGDANFGYTIQFENQPSANAPAQVVTVTQTLDADLDFSTFRFTSFGFGDFKIDVPTGLDGTSFETIFDATAELGVLVQIEAELNTISGLLEVTFTSLDPLTNEVPADPLAGFLPPNLLAPEGDGFLTYSVAPKSGLANGTRFDALASIVFDTEAAIATPFVHNTLDNVAPTSQVSALPATTSRMAFAVKWTSLDDAGGSGVRGTSIFFTDTFNGVESGLQPLTVDNAASGLRFTGAVGHTYKFFSTAIDAVGNVEAIGGSADATITVVAPTLLAVGRARTFTDADGDLYSVRLTGPGTINAVLLDPDNDGKGSLDQLFVSGTTARSAISVLVYRNSLDGPDLDTLPDGDGFVSIGDVTVTGSLGTFSAGGSDLVVDGFTATGSVGRIIVRDILRPEPVLTDPAIEVGGTAANRLAVSAREVADGFTLSTLGYLTTFGAASIGEGSISAARLGTLATTVGAMNADLNIAGPVTQIIVKNGVNEGNWNAGSIGLVWVKGGSFNADVTTTGAVGRVIVSNGAVTGELEARNFGSISVAGGDFSGTVTSTTPAATLRRAPALGALSVFGGNFTGDVNVLGVIGSVVVRENTLGAGGELSGDLSALRFGGVSVSGGDFSGSLTSLTPAAALGTSAALGGITVVGGDFTGDVRLLGSAGAVNVLASRAGVGGNMTDASIAAANIAALTVSKNVANSVVLAGADLGPDHTFGGGNDVFARGSIGNAFIGGNVSGNSVIAAGLTTTNSILKDSDDAIVGATTTERLASRIARLIIAGSADASSYFAAGRFTSPPKIANAFVAPATDPQDRFLIG